MCLVVRAMLTRRRALVCPPRPPTSFPPPFGKHTQPRYHDPDCDGDPATGANPHWYIGTVKPSLTAASDLDGNKACEYDQVGSPLAVSALADESTNYLPPDGMQWIIFGAEKDCIQNGPTFVTLLVTPWQRFHGGSQYAQIHINNIPSADGTVGAETLPPPVNWKDAQAICAKMGDGATLLDVVKDSPEDVYVRRIGVGLNAAPSWVGCTDADYGKGWSCDDDRNYFTCEVSSPSTALHCTVYCTVYCTAAARPPSHPCMHANRRLQSVC